MEHCVAPHVRVTVTRRYAAETGGNEYVQNFSRPVVGIVAFVTVIMVDQFTPSVDALRVKSRGDWDKAMVSSRE